MAGFCLGGVRIPLVMRKCEEKPCGIRYLFRVCRSADREECTSSGRVSPPFADIRYLFGWVEAPRRFCQRFPGCFPSAGMTVSVRAGSRRAGAPEVAAPAPEAPPAKAPASTEQVSISLIDLLEELKNHVGTDKQEGLQQLNRVF